MCTLDVHGFSAEEKNNIRNLVDAHFMTDSDLTPMDTGRLRGLPVSALKQLCRKRALTCGGNKTDLVRRLHEEAVDLEFIRSRACAYIDSFIQRCIYRNGRDGMGDKPPELNVVEYWLAHVEQKNVDSFWGTFLKPRRRLLRPGLPHEKVGGE